MTNSNSILVDFLSILVVLTLYSCLLTGTQGILANLARNHEGIFSSIQALILILKGSWNLRKSVVNMVPKLNFAGFRLRAILSYPSLRLFANGLEVP